MAKKAPEPAKASKAASSKPPAKAAAKAAPAKAAAKPAEKAPAKAAATSGKAATKAATPKPANASASGKAQPSTKAPAAKSAPAKATAAKAGKPAAKAAAKTSEASAPKVSSAFDAKFLESQRKLLLEERARLLGQSQSLEYEAAALMSDLEPGDVQFDDESGEGDSIVVERERDLALAAQARDTVAAIDAALARLDGGTYGLSVVSGRPIPRERLKAIPWATELVEEKVGGLGSRR
jgi:RNA polymerase-binding transcription factor DksA